MRDPISSERTRVEPCGALSCLDHGRHKLLGKITRQGILLYCTLCRAERLIPWCAVDWFRSQLGSSPTQGQTNQQARILDKGSRMR